MSYENTCCFTGHRSNKLPWKDNESDERCVGLKSEIAARLEGIYESGYRHFICGMALGCDTYFAQAVLALKSIHPDVTLEAAIPCRTQPDGWKKRSQEEYSELVSQCNKVTVLQENYSRGCMMVRNRYMVDNSSLLLACYSGLTGGTMNTILYAERSGIPVIMIDIDEYA